MIKTAIALSLSTGLGATNMLQDNNTVFFGAGGAAISEVGVRFVWRNEKLLKALRRIEARSAGKRLTPGHATIKIIREGRAGGMYGVPSGS